MDLLAVLHSGLLMVMRVGKIGITSSPSMHLYASIIFAMMLMQNSVMLLFIAAASVAYVVKYNLRYLYLQYDVTLYVCSTTFQKEILFCVRATNS